MSTPDPGRPLDPDAPLDTAAIDPAAEGTALEAARIEVADRIREMSHALMRHGQDPAVLESLSAELGARLAELTAGPVTQRSLAGWAESRQNTAPPADGAVFPHHLERPVSGPGNPWSISFDVVRRGDRATATVNLGSAYEGAPHRSHGGVVAAIFDDLCGYILAMEQTMAFTAWLRVEFHHSTPLHTPITFATWLDRQEGRKMFIKGECTDGDTILTSCEALFVTVAT